MQHSIEGLQSASVHLAPGRLRELLGDSSNDVRLASLEDCTVSLCDVMGALRVHGLKRCRVYGGPIAGSVHLERCVDCVFFLASRQIRLHESERCDFYLHVLSNPIIEDCTKLRFSPYTLLYDAFDDQLVAAGLRVGSGCPLASCQSF